MPYEPETRRQHWESGANLAARVLREAGTVIPDELEALHQAQSSLMDRYWDLKAGLDAVLPAEKRLLQRLDELEAQRQAAQLLSLPVEPAEPPRLVYRAELPQLAERTAQLVRDWQAAGAEAAELAAVAFTGGELPTAVKAFAEAGRCYTQAKYLLLVWLRVHGVDATAGM